MKRENGWHKLATQEEILTCLSCPYDDCTGTEKCKRVAIFRKSKDTQELWNERREEITQLVADGKTIAQLMDIFGIKFHQAHVLRLSARAELEDRWRKNHAENYD